MERVYCLPAAVLPDPQGEVLPLTPGLFKRIVTTGTFLPRAEVEEDERWRQIVPYAVLERPELAEVFLVERLGKGSETRLHHKLSIGLGGHINPGDGDRARDPVEGALTRELHEELQIRAFFAEAVGLIHSAGGPVDRVHTGILYRVRSPGEVKVREQDKLSGTFVPWGRAWGGYERLEGWSQSVLRFLKPEPGRQE